MLFYSGGKRERKKRVYKKNKTISKKKWRYLTLRYLTDNMIKIYGRKRGSKGIHFRKNLRTIQLTDAAEKVASSLAKENKLGKIISLLLEHNYGKLASPNARIKQLKLERDQLIEERRNRMQVVNSMYEGMLNRIENAIQQEGESMKMLIPKTDEALKILENEKGETNGE